MGGRLSRCLPCAKPSYSEASCSEPSCSEPSSYAEPSHPVPGRAYMTRAPSVQRQSRDQHQVSICSMRNECYSTEDQVIDDELSSLCEPLYDSLAEVEPPFPSDKYNLVVPSRSESHVWRVSITNKAAFLASDGHLLFHTTLFVPEAALSQTIRSPLKTEIKQKISDDAKHLTDGEGQIGPMICFTPHGAQFRRPLMALITLTKEMFHDDDMYDYTVVHSDTLEVPLEEWEEVSEYKPGDVSSLVLPQHQAVVLLLSHFSWFALFRRYRRKTVCVEAYTMWKNTEPRVKVTCRLRLDAVHGTDSSEKYPHGPPGELADYRKMVISCSPAHIIICVRSWYDDHWYLETDRSESIERRIVWTGSMANSTFWFRAKKSEAPRMFTCTIEAGQSPNLPVPLHVNLMHEEPNIVNEIAPESDGGASGDLSNGSKHTAPKPLNDKTTQGDDIQPKADNGNRYPAVEQPQSDPASSPAQGDDTQPKAGNTPVHVNPEEQPLELMCPNSAVQNIHLEATHIWNVYGNLPPDYLAQYTNEERRALQQHPDMEKRSIDRLKELHSILRETMDPDGICSVFYSKHLITHEQYQKFTKKDTPEQNEFILDVVRRQDNVELLQEILRQKCQGNIADMIQHHLEQTKPKVLE